MESGISTFVELTPDPITGKTISAYQRLQNLMEEIELADQLGLDVFAIGEHHRPDFLVSSPATVLAAAAGRTKKIKLSSAVSVLSSDDPVRVFQRFSTLNALSTNELAQRQVTGNRTVTARRHLLRDHQIRKRPDAFDRTPLHEAPRRPTIANRNSTYRFESRDEPRRAVRHHDGASLERREHHLLDVLGLVRRVEQQLGPVRHPR